MSQFIQRFQNSLLSNHPGLSGGLESANQQRKVLFLLMAVLLTSLACGLGSFKKPAAPSVTPFSTPSVTAFPTWTPTKIPVATPTRLAATTAPLADSESDIHLWAVQAFSDRDDADPDWALGKPGVIGCSDPVLTTWAPGASDQPAMLTLNYATPLLANRLDLYYIGDPGKILRIEVLNSLSGLGSLIHDGSQTTLSAADSEQCPDILHLPIDVDFEIDIVILTIAGSQSPIQIDAVGLAGDMLGYVDAPVFWRVPLPNTPISLATGKNGLIYAVTADGGLFAYDVEGNQLREISTPTETWLSDVTADPSGNLLVIDEIYGWFVLMTPEGEHLTIGGDSLFGEAAIDPRGEAAYILMDHTIQVYSIVSGEILREIELAEDSVYSSLVFDRQDRLFLLRNPQWEPELFEIDPLTGEELDAIPLSRANQYSYEIVADDLAVDNEGNFYILFSMNTGQIAIHVLDANGSFVQRFGQLTSDFDAWTEGSFLDPRAITVSADGRFVVVADGFEDQAYLTAFLLEVEE